MAEGIGAAPSLKIMPVLNNISQSESNKNDAGANASQNHPDAPVQAPQSLVDAVDNNV